MVQRHGRPCLVPSRAGRDAAEDPSEVFSAVGKGRPFATMTAIANVGRGCFGPCAHLDRRLAAAGKEARASEPRLPLGSTPPGRWLDPTRPRGVEALPLSSGNHRLRIGGLTCPAPSAREPVPRFRLYRRAGRLEKDDHHTADEYELPPLSKSRPVAAAPGAASLREASSRWAADPDPAACTPGEGSRPFWRSAWDYRLWCP